MQKGLWLTTDDRHEGLPQSGRIFTAEQRIATKGTKRGTVSDPGEVHPAEWQVSALTCFRPGSHPYGNQTQALAASIRSTTCCLYSFDRLRKYAL